MEKMYSLMASDGAFIKLRLLENISINGLTPVYSKTYEEGCKICDDDLIIGEEALVKELNRLRNGGFSDL